ncbi:YxD-tail cyclophane-containing RiPP peptide [Streptomyces rimosus]|uniref:YxD-tail cyclophane-containing RiPP peptide n=1 Tax=Streptomyces rimosus TaxID=1927 RepID=UPI00373AEB0A
MRQTGSRKRSSGQRYTADPPRLGSNSSTHPPPEACQLPDYSALPLGELASCTEHPVLSTLLPGVCARLEDSGGAVAFYDDGPPVA